MVDWQQQGHPRHAPSPPRQRYGVRMLKVEETAQLLQWTLSIFISPSRSAWSDKSLQELFHHLPSFFWGKWEVMNSY